MHNDPLRQVAAMDGGVVHVSCAVVHEQTRYTDGIGAALGGYDHQE